MGLLDDGLRSAVPFSYLCRLPLQHSTELDGGGLELELDWSRQEPIPEDRGGQELDRGGQELDGGGRELDGGGQQLDWCS